MPISHGRVLLAEYLDKPGGERRAGLRFFTCGTYVLISIAYNLLLAP